MYVCKLKGVASIIETKGCFELKLPQQQSWTDASATRVIIFKSHFLKCKLIDWNLPKVLLPYWLLITFIVVLRLSNCSLLALLPHIACSWILRVSEFSPGLAQAFLGHWAELTWGCAAQILWFADQQIINLSFTWKEMWESQGFETMG